MHRNQKLKENWSLNNELYLQYVIFEKINLIRRKDIYISSNIFFIYIYKNLCIFMSLKI